MKTSPHVHFCGKCWSGHLYRRAKASRNALLWREIQLNLWGGLPTMIIRPSPQCAASAHLRCAVGDHVEAALQQTWLRPFAPFCVCFAFVFCSLLSFLRLENACHLCLTRVLFCCFILSMYEGRKRLGDRLRRILSLLDDLCRINNAQSSQARWKSQQPVSLHCSVDSGQSALELILARWQSLKVAGSLQRRVSTI